MRVLILTTTFPPLVGGIGTFAYNLAKGLQETGVLIQMLTSVGSQDPESTQGVKVLRTPNFMNKRYLKIIPLFFAALWTSMMKRPDRLLAMTWTHEGLVSYLVKRITGVHYALVAHGSEILQNQNTKIRRYIMLRIFEGADTVIANSAFTKQLVLALGIKPSSVIVINPPISLPNMSYKDNAQALDKKFDLKGKRVIFTAAKLVKRKGHALVIQILGKLGARYPDLVYVMTGEGAYREELESLAIKYNVKDRVRMIGYVSQAELQQLYVRAELYISPAQEDCGDVEGFGIALIEAGAHGTPVIAGRGGGVTDAVLDGETGFLVNGSNLDQTIRILKLLLDDERLRVRMGKNARERTIREFSLSRQGARLRQVLEGTLEQETTSNVMPI